MKGVLAMYVPPDPQRMEQAYQAGNVVLNPVPGAVNLVFSDYAQPGDKMTLTLDTATKKITTLSVDTYMGEAKDKVSLQVRMGSLPWHQLCPADGFERICEGTHRHHNQFRLSKALNFLLAWKSALGVSLAKDW